MESVTFKPFNAMRIKLIVCLWMCLTDGVFGAETDELKTEEVSKVEGESVTLHSGVEEYNQISWMLGPEHRNIAKCRGNTDGTRSCEITDEGLRDRLKTDNQTGSLSIINISTGLAGLYKLQIIDKAFKESYKKFSVTVSGVFGVEAVEEVRKVEGESATLHSGVQKYQRIIWLFGPQKKIMAQCRENASGNPWCETTDPRLNRLKTDDQTGSLTINNISKEDAGHYYLQIFNNLPDKEFNVIVSAALPVPMIVKDSEKSSSSQCVLLCSVMNVMEATLCWYKENSLISSVSVSDLNNSFSRPLEVNYQDFSNYSCVLNNSISSQTTHLNITELCQPCPEPGKDRGYIAQICVPLVVLVLVLGGAWIFWKKRRAKQNGVL